MKTRQDGLNRRSLMQAGICAAAMIGRPRFTWAAGRTDPLQLDSGRVPLSRFGSYLTVSKHFWPFGVSEAVPAGSFYVRCLEDDPGPPETFRIELLRGAETAAVESESTPGRLVLQCAAEANGRGRVEFCVAEKDTIRIRGAGCVLRLHTVIGPYANAVKVREGVWRIIPDAGRSPVEVRLLSGSMRVDAPWVDGLSHVQPKQATLTFHADSSESFEAALQFYEGEPKARRDTVSFDVAAAAVAQEFEEWAAQVPALDRRFEAGRKLAAYVLWSSTVDPRGLYKTPVVWGSKNWMARIWSWDHCFAAIGLAKSHPELAWDQYMIFRDMQDPSSGMLADSMSTIKRSWVCTKDPVHGWALRHLMRRMPATVTTRRLREAYGPLQLWTNFWVKHRNLDGDGLPCILHPNESFDNTTANTMGGAVKAPEIATYLAVQMDVLSEVAARLGYTADATRWRQQRDGLISAMVKILWDGREERFVSKRVGDGQVGPGDSVLAFMPLMLGQRLNSEILAKLVAGLKTPGRFLTPYGFSTEALTSPFYDGNTYVKGPVWAPMNIFLSQGLEQVGEAEMARDIRTRFLSVCLKGGMSEHFDARTGAPQGDPAYIWTAAMYLHLAGAKSGG